MNWKGIGTALGNLMNCRTKTSLEPKKFDVGVVIAELTVYEGGTLVGRYYKVVRGGLFYDYFNEETVTVSATERLNEILNNRAQRFISVINHLGLPDKEGVDGLVKQTNGTVTDLNVHHPIQLASHSILESRIIRSYDYWLNEDGSPVR